MVATSGAVTVARAWIECPRTAVLGGAAFRGAVETLAQRLDGSPVDGLDEPGADACKALMGRLNAMRCFTESVRLGRAAVARHGDDVGLHRLLVQALIDAGDLDGAGRALDAADRAFPDPRGPEAAEIEGLRGRLAKQRFVVQRSRFGTGGEASLQAALRAYADRYGQDPQRPAWHGINAVALAMAAERLQIDPGMRFDAGAAAAEILSSCAERFADDPDDLWSVATAAEAALALRRHADAELWMYRYATHPDVTPFMLASTARQLREIWGLRLESPRGGRCLLILEQQMARRGLFELRSGETRPDPAGAGPSLERVFGKERFMGYDRFRRALDACASVARIEEAGSGRGVGTGFLIDGRALSDRLPDRPLLLTNAHVIEPAGVGGALPPAEARVRFEVAARRSTAYAPLAIDEVIWTSPPAAVGDRSCPDSFVDLSICTLKELPPDTPVLKLSPRPPLLSDGSKAYVIGHPDGDGLQFSLADSQLLDVCDALKLVHYRTPTVGGSSGSPVFDGDWAVYAIHHAGQVDAPRLHGEGTYEANEGISIAAIRRAVEAAPP